MDIDTISGLVSKILEDRHFDDCFLIDVKISNKKIEVFIDSDETVSFDKCQRISRDLEEILDERKWFGEAYILEVSSAGVGAPLKFPRQYMKNIGRKILIKTSEGEKYEGILTHADDKGFTVAWKDRIREGNKKKNIEKDKSLPYSDVKEAKIKISFK